MNTRSALRISFGLMMALALMLVPMARADEGDQATQFTFNQPFKIPGNNVLAAGTYWFVTGTDAPAHNVVQIFNADRSKLDATILVVSAVRATPTQDSQLSFAEPSGNEPMALLKWFYPERTIGYEFVYSPRQEKVISHEPVLTVTASPAHAASGD